MLSTDNCLLQSRRLSLKSSQYFCDQKKKLFMSCPWTQYDYKIRKYESNRFFWNLYAFRNATTTRRGIQFLNSWVTDLVCFLNLHPVNIGAAMGCLLLHVACSSMKWIISDSGLQHSVIQKKVFSHHKTLSCWAAHSTLCHTLLGITEPIWYSANRPCQILLNLTEWKHVLETLCCSMYIQLTLPPFL